MSASQDAMIRLYSVDDVCNKRRMTPQQPPRARRAVSFCVHAYRYTAIIVLTGLALLFASSFVSAGRGSFREDICKRMAMKKRQRW